MATRLEQEARVAKAIARLTASGYKFHLESPNPDEVMLVVDIDSIGQRIKSQLQYPKKEIRREGKYFLIHFWRGENPTFSLDTQETKPNV